MPKGGMERRLSRRTSPCRSAHCASRCHRNSGRQPSRRATGGAVAWGWAPAADTAPERDRQQRSKKRRYGFNSRSVHSKDRLQLVEALLGRIVRLEPRRSLQWGDERMEGAVGVIGRALKTQARVRAGDALGQSRRKARFADPRLARDQHDLPLARPGQALALQQEIELILAADEIGQTRHADRLE